MRLDNIFNFKKNILKVDHYRKEFNDLNLLNFDNSLIAYYPFDGDVKDYSGNGFDLVPHNDPIFESGKYKLCTYLNNNYYAVDYNLLKGRTLPVTFAFWIKTSDTSADGEYDYCQSTIIGFATTGNNSNDFGIELKSGYLHIFNGLGEEIYYQTNYFISDKTWHHITIVFAPSYFKIYIDKQLKETHNHDTVNSFSVQDEINSNSIAIGAFYSFHYNSYMNGSYLQDTYLDDFRIYQKELTQDEINLL